MTYECVNQINNCQLTCSFLYGVISSFVWCVVCFDGYFVGLCCVQFEGTKYEYERELQSGFWKDFCSKNKGYHQYRLYECKQLGFDDELIMKDQILACKWDDYVRLRLNLFESIVKPTFKSYEKFSFRFTRTQVGCIFGNNCFFEELSNIPLFKNIVTELDDIDNSTKTELNAYDQQPESQQQSQEQQPRMSNSKRFFMIWNGMFTMFSKRHGLSFWKSNDANKAETREDANKRLFDSLKAFIVDRIKLSRLNDEANKNDNNDNTSLTKCLNSIKENETSFDELIKYCIQDIDDASIYSEDSGIHFYVVNRLACCIYFGVFAKEHDWNSSSNVSNDNQVEELLSTVFIKDLTKVFEFLWDFSIYNMLYCGGIPSRYAVGEYESFYIGQYFGLKDHCFDEKYFLLNCSFVDDSRNDGTLLHGATKHNMQFYVQVLLNDGFDCQKINNVNLKYTPYDIAKKSHKVAILTKYDSLISHISATERSIIESFYFVFKTQMTFCKHILYCMGLTKKRGIDEDKFYSDQNSLMGLKHEKDAHGDFYTDDLLVNFNQFSGLKIKGLVLGDHESFGDKVSHDKSIELAAIGITQFVRGIIQLLLKKCAISDDMLILCFEYCKAVKGNLIDEFKNALRKTVCECLAIGFKQKETKDYYYAWFKEYLLTSHIWLCKDNRNDESLFDFLMLTIGKSFMKQQEFIWQNVKMVEKKDSESWNELLQYKGENENGIWLNKKYYDGLSYGLRQDHIPNGIKSSINIKDTFIMMPLMDETSTYDVFSEWNNKVYITKCLAFAHRTNPRLI